MNTRVEEMIRKSLLFEGISMRDFYPVANLFNPYRVQKGDVIFQEGAEGNEMYILISGKIDAWVGLSRGVQHQMFEIIPGDFFGEMSIIAKESRSATLIAAMDSELMVLKASDFFRIIFERPMIAFRILSNIRKVQNTWLEQTSVYLSDLMRWGETARRRSIIDELTGLYNRRFLDESGNGRFSQGAVGIRSMSLLMMDLDKIHIINENHGMEGGDRVFVSMGNILRSTSRPTDICARLAGDEFAVLLPDTSLNEACSVAERILNAASIRIVNVPKEPGSAETVEVIVPTSIGIAAAPLHADNWGDLVNAADAGLRQAKELGRNRVEIFGGFK